MLLPTQKELRKVLAASNIALNDGRWVVIPKKGTTFCILIEPPTVLRFREAGIEISSLDDIVPLLEQAGYRRITGDGENVSYELSEG